MLGEPLFARPVPQGEAVRSWQKDQDEEAPKKKTSGASSLDPH
jgi:hypothetical protein